MEGQNIHKFNQQLYTEIINMTNCNLLPVCEIKRLLLLIVTSSAIDKMFDIFGPIFEQNVTINFEPIFEQNANFDPIFKKKCVFWSNFRKKCEFRTFCQW